MSGPGVMDWDDIESEVRSSLDEDPPKPPVRSGFADKREAPKPRGFFSAPRPEFLRSMAQGAAYGFADEIEAGIRAPFSDRSYRDIQQEIQGSNTAFRSANPGTAFTAEVGGGLLTGGALKKLAGAAAPVIGRVSERAARGLNALVGGAFRENAVEGAVNAVGASEDGVSAGDVGFGATVGGTMGKVLPKIGGVFRRESAEDAARRLGRDVLDRDGGARAWETRRDELAATGTPFTVMDAGGETALRTVRGEVSKGTEVGNTIRDRMLGARELMTDRIRQAARAALGGDAVDTEAVAKSVREAAGQLADRSYGEVFSRNATIEGPQLAALLQNPTVRRAWDRVAEIDANFSAAGQGRRYGIEQSMAMPGSGTGTNVPAVISDLDGRLPANFDEFVKSGRMDLRSADALKRGLDDIIRNGFDGSTSGGLRGETRKSVIALKDALLGMADEADELAVKQKVGLTGRGTDVVQKGEAATPGKTYREARKEFETAMGWINALENGEELFTADLSTVRGTLAGLSKEQRTIAQLGFRTQVLDRLAKGDEGRDRTRGWLNSPDFKEKVKLLYGEQADEFLRKIKNERQVAGNTGRITGGSSTAPQLADQAGEGFGATDAVDAVRAARGGIGGLVDLGLRRGARMIDEQRVGGNAAARARLAEQLGREGVALEDVLNWMAAREGTPNFDRAARVAGPLTRSATGAATRGLERLFD